MLTTLLLTALLGAQGAAAQTCDRDCLRGVMTQYLEALVARNPAAAPVAPNVRFTEDTVEKKLGEGLWTTATRLRPYRQDVIDVRRGIAASFVVVEEGSTPAMVVVRLKVVDRRITEAETVVVRGAKEGMLFDVEALKEPSTAMLLVPERSQLHTREDAIRIAETYPAGLKVGSFVKVDAPFAPDAYRFENGRLMAGPGCTFLPGCDDIKNQRIPTLSEVTYRVAAVDEELGIVLLRLDFGANSTRGQNESLTVWEAFKVYGGQIHAVEAFMEVMPHGGSSGWDSADAR